MSPVAPHVVDVVPAPLRLHFRRRCPFPPTLAAPPGAKPEAEWATARPAPPMGPGAPAAPAPGLVHATLVVAANPALPAAPAPAFATWMSMLASAP